LLGNFAISFATTLDERAGNGLGAFGFSLSLGVSGGALDFAGLALFLGFNFF